jgi:diaminohydroxyphosphoribosylaminopyrimidine deaminase / 5-amino-6-(5-phosphoribosylamino)uracil reductase
VHLLRSQHDAVLVGARTVSVDNPRLTVRTVKGKNPVRVILDGRFTCAPHAKVFSQTGDAKTIIVVSRRFSRRKQALRSQFMEANVSIIELEGDSSGKVSLKDLLAELGRLGISSVLVEGGAATFSAFVKEKVADKLVIFIAPKIMGPGLRAFSHVSESSGVTLRRVRSQYAGVDLVVSGYLL